MDTDVHRTSPSLVKPTVPLEVKSLASATLINKTVTAIKIHTSEIRGRIVIPGIIKRARYALIVDDRQIRGVLRIRSGLLDFCDVNPHNDKTSSFPNVERVKRGFVPFGVGEVVTKEIVVVKEAYNLQEIQLLTIG